MEKTNILLLIFALLIMSINNQSSSQTTRKGVLLEDLTWVEAEKVLTDPRPEIRGRGREQTPVRVHQTL